MLVERYLPANGLWVITTYYNPCRYKTRRRNYDAFVKSLLRSGIPLLTVECAFDGEPFELPPSPHVHQVRSNSLFWQKERLLNLAASWLPASCEDVAWIDCDVLFKNPSWAVDAVRLLKNHKVVQLFESADRLDRRGKSTGDIVKSFASVTVPDPEAAFSFQRYDFHGHTGYAWAMKRELFTQIGLYEYAISGSSDHFMAHAIYGECGFCIKNTLRIRCQYDHFEAWSHAFHDEVKGSLAVVPGELVHLWHGNLADRRYLQRNLEICEMNYDPFTDVRADPGRPMEWQTDKQELKQYFYEFFKTRKEDGHARDRSSDRDRFAAVEGGQGAASATAG